MTDRIITRALAALALSIALLPTSPVSAGDVRLYAVGVGQAQMPTCEGEGSYSVFSVCYDLSGTETSVEVTISDDVWMNKVLGVILFYDSLGSQVGDASVICGQTAAPLDIPEDAEEMRVVVGALPNVFTLLAQSCVAGFGTRGYVEAEF